MIVPADEACGRGTVSMLGVMAIALGDGGAALDTAKLRIAVLISLKRANWSRPALISATRAGNLRQ